MEQTLYFHQMFSDCDIPETIAGLMCNTLIRRANIDVENRYIFVELFSPVYIPEKDLNDLKVSLIAQYELHAIDFDIYHPADQLCHIHTDELRDLFVRLDSMARGSLAGAMWIWEGSHLTVKLKGNGKDALLKNAPTVTQLLSRRFGTDVSIEIVAGESLEGEALFGAMEKLRTQILEEAPVVMAAPVKPTAPVTAMSSDTFFGKPFRGNVTPMKDIDLNMGNVIIEGAVFAIDHKELPKRNAVVIKFDVTDHTSSIRISRFLENKEAAPILKEIKIGSVVRISGRPMVDNFTNEMVLKPNAIIAGTMPKRKDTAVGDKRVELHLHTVMSSMDALTNTKAVIKQAAAWGHKAIAITDHGCV